jgi:hypothetical protein
MRFDLTRDASMLCVVVGAQSHVKQVNEFFVGFERTNALWNVRAVTFPVSEELRGYMTVWFRPRRTMVWQNRSGSASPSRLDLLWDVVLGLGLLDRIMTEVFRLGFGFLRPRLVQSINPHLRLLNPLLPNLQDKQSGTVTIETTFLTGP